MYHTLECAAQITRSPLVARKFPGYIPITAPAYFTLGTLRITDKFFAYAAVLVVSERRCWLESAKITTLASATPLRIWEDDNNFSANVPTRSLCSLPPPTRGAQRRPLDVAWWWRFSIGLASHLFKASASLVSDYSRWVEDSWGFVQHSELPFAQANLYE